MNKKILMTASLSAVCLLGAGFTAKAKSLITNCPEARHPQNCEHFELSSDRSAVRTAVYPAASTAGDGYHYADDHHAEHESCGDSAGHHSQRYSSAAGTSRHHGGHH